MKGVSDGFGGVRDGSKAVGNDSEAVNDGSRGVKNPFGVVNDGFRGVNDGSGAVPDGSEAVRNGFDSVSDAFGVVANGFQRQRRGFVMAIIAATKTSRWSCSAPSAHAGVAIIFGAVGARSGPFKPRSSPATL